MWQEDVEKAFTIIDNEEKMRIKVFKDKNPKLMDRKVGETKYLRNFIRRILKALSKVGNSRSDKIFLGLRPESWDNLFECIRKEKSKIDVGGNFWAAIQFLESQLDIKKTIKK